MILFLTRKYKYIDLEYIFILKGSSQKPDQETWLCQTHLDDLKDNIGPYYVILDHIGPFWTILDNVVLFRIIIDILKNILSNFWLFKNYFRPFGQLLNHVGHVWTC